MTRDKERKTHDEGRGTKDDLEMFQASLERLDSLIQKAHRMAAAEEASDLREVVQILLEVHGKGLGRIVAHIAASPAGPEIIAACQNDDVVSGLLLLHGLHPASLEDRARLAIDQLRPILHSHAGSLELEEIDRGVVRLRLTLLDPRRRTDLEPVKKAIDEALNSHIPDAAAVEIAGLEELQDRNPRYELLVL